MNAYLPRVLPIQAARIVSVEHLPRVMRYVVTTDDGETHQVDVMETGMQPPMPGDYLTDIHPRVIRAAEFNRRFEPCD